ncbi:hypothetical protein [Streptomyces sp. NPDC094032]|uniref:hypothetical protein n=1 Tax=Streptomyces sp. NPDC094032 TaxID=3155308 RepID=UPI0033293EBE
MESIHGRLQALASELSEDPAIRVLEYSLTEPASSHDLEQGAETASEGLPQGLVDLYAEVGSFHLEWEHIKVPDVRGAINILPLAEVLGDWQGVTWFQGDEEFRPVLPFDKFTSEACAALIRGADGHILPTVAYHYFGEELHHTDYSVEEYLDRLINARGYWYWQTTLCSDLTASTTASDFHRNMPLLFSDYDSSLFQPR